MIDDEYNRAMSYLRPALECQYLDEFGGLLRLYVLKKYLS